MGFVGGKVACGLVKGTEGNERIFCCVLFTLLQDKQCLDRGPFGEGVDSARYNQQYLLLHEV